MKKFNLKKEKEKWFDKWLHKKLTGRAIVELNKIDKLFIKKLNKSLKDWSGADSDITCDIVERLSGGD